jgi:hypothetical protein
LTLECAFRILAKFRSLASNAPCSARRERVRTSLEVLALVKAHGVDEAEMYFTRFRPVGATCVTAPAQVATKIQVAKTAWPYAKQATL